MKKKDIENDVADARRYRAWRDGEVIVRQNDNGLWETRHRDSSHWDIFSWYVSPSLDEAIDAAITSPSKT